MLVIINAFKKRTHQDVQSSFVILTICEPNAKVLDNVDTGSSDFLSEHAFGALEIKSKASDFHLIFPLSKVFLNIWKW